MKKKLQKLAKQQAYKKIYSPDDAVGWNCIDQKLEEIYGEQKPKHWGAVPHFSIGGPDPIDGISFYQSKKYRSHVHAISYGMSNLYYDPDKVEDEFSKWGFEFTFRLKPFSGDTGEIPSWVVHVMNNLARYVYKSGKWFEPGHFIPANGPIRFDCDTNLTGFIFLNDPELGVMDTPHGKVSFLQMFGITDSELESLKDNPSVESVHKLAEQFQETNPYLITDLERN